MNRLGTSFALLTILGSLVYPRAVLSQASQDVGSDPEYSDICHVYWVDQNLAEQFRAEISEIFTDEGLKAAAEKYAALGGEGILGQCCPGGISSRAVKYLSISWLTANTAGNDWK